jgi:hypothetical protein
MNAGIREEALLTLQGRGAILDVARQVSDLLRAERIEGAVIGGVAVVLHGHVRTTVDVDVYAPDHGRLAAVLRERGFGFEPDERQFVKDRVPVHLVTISQLEVPPSRFEDREGVLTVSLEDLINIKLRTGTRDPLRAQDLADVIGLIEANNLTSAFAPKIRKEHRPEFRKLVQAIQHRDG